MHALDERVLSDDQAVRELGGVVLDSLRETSPLELGEQSELPELRELHRAQAEDVDRALAAPSSTSPWATAAGSDLGARRAQPPRASSSREQCSERRRVRAARPPCVAATSWRGTGISTIRPPSNSVSTASSPWPPVTIDRARAERVQAASELLAGRRAAGESLRLAQVGGDHRREREQLLDQRRDRVLAQQARTRARDHHRVDDERDRVPRRKPATVSMIGREKSMPVLAASAPMSANTASSWARRTPAAPRGRPSRRPCSGPSARRSRSSRSSPRGERLQVGLDAGAAPGVRACDRQTARYGHAGIIGAWTPRRGVTGWPTGATQPSPQ